MRDYPDTLSAYGRDFSRVYDPAGYWVIWHETYPFTNDKQGVNIFPSDKRF